MDERASGPAPVASRTIVPRGVAVAAATTAVGAAALVPAFSGPAAPTGVLFLLGWPALGLVAAVLLDRDDGSRLGRTLAALAAVPAVLVPVAAVTADGADVWNRLERVVRPADVVVVLLALTAVGWSVGFAPDRTSRRRLVWVVVWSAALVAAVGAASLLSAPRTTALVTTLGLVGLAGILLRLETADELRPVDEPALDVALGLVTVLAGVGAGAGARVLTAGVGLPLPEVSGGFAAVLTAALVWPVAVHVRRSVLARRYGTGLLSPAAVAAVSTDLRPDADPRGLLARAERTVAAASGHATIRLVLGVDVPDRPDGWDEYPLVVAEDRVGTLLARARHPEGPEPRQVRTIRALLPTVALMTRAVALAVEAEQAREDAAHERQAERARILGDLHDGLGPVLAGLSMRVQAEWRRDRTPALATVAEALADSRTELRRIVSDLMPSALDGTPLPVALQRLVATFADERAEIALRTEVSTEPPAEVSVAVYRSVAEGVTNALRHGRARHVEVVVHAGPTEVAVDVRDDGCGGVVVPGVGLASLRRRAEGLGGRLDVTGTVSAGTRLRVTLPVEEDT